MRIVAGVAVEVQDERRVTVNPQRAGGNERALDAMRPPPTQHLADGEDRFASDLVVDRDGIEECLRPLRRGHPLEDRELTARKAEIVTTGESDARQALHVQNDPPMRCVRTARAY